MGLKYSEVISGNDIKYEICLKNMFTSTCQLWTWTTLQKHRQCEAFKTDTVTAKLNSWKINIFTRLKSMLLKLVLLLFCFIPCFPFFHSSQQSCPKLRSKPAYKRYSSWPDKCHGFRPRKWSLNCWECASHLWDARLFLHKCHTVIQFYTAVYSTYAQIIEKDNPLFFKMNTSILPPVYTTMPYLGQPGLVFRGVDVSILLHGLRLIIVSKIMNLVNLLALGKDLKISHANITWNKHYYCKQICHVTYHIHIIFQNKYSNKWVTTFQVVKLEVPNWV